MSSRSARPWQRSQSAQQLERKLEPLWLGEESALIRQLLPDATPAEEARERIRQLAHQLAGTLREQSRLHPGLESLLSEYAISSEEGVILMCLAEALLRIPDDASAMLFLRDQVRGGDWARHLSHSPSFWVNASTWGLLVCGRFLELQRARADKLLGQMLARLGEPVMLGACRQAVELIGSRFVTGRNIDEAMAEAASQRQAGQCHSFDMLGEAALTGAAANDYFEAYANAIRQLGKAPCNEPVNSISVKLSALHPRYEIAQRARCLPAIHERVTELCRLAREVGIGLTIDAEEAARLQLSLELFESVYALPDHRDWDGFGLAVQAYQKRAPAVIDWLGELAARHGRRIPLRLVKGAYWDTEIKHAQVEALSGYPVYLNKACTDVAWLACARRLLGRGSLFYPQFATHNAHSVASVLVMAEDMGSRDFELQRLHGMGEALHEHLHAMCPWLTLRVYAPVGPYRELLPYLVRRLLENGANSSFLHQLAEPEAQLAPLLREPANLLREQCAASPIVLPQDLCLPERKLAAGRNLDSGLELQAMQQSIHSQTRGQWYSAPRGKSPEQQQDQRNVCAPADGARALGVAVAADKQDCEAALAIAQDAWPAWEARGGPARAEILETIGALYQAHRDELAARIVMEGGRTIASAVGEIREATDFCYYYAAAARRQFGGPLELAGPTGEHNLYQLRARGSFACISPWNFPLAIFSGQILAALAAGNAVLAKPASPTPLTAMRAVELMHAAGVPEDVLHYLPASASCFSETVLEHPLLGGIAFTGSNASADRIREVLSRPGRPAIPFIAETGGINCMIVDSSALPEQVVNDSIRSAFDSAGQRCSALRILCLQEDIAAQVCAMLAGAIQELSVGPPWLADSDVGPVISAGAGNELLQHRQWLEENGRLLAQATLPSSCDDGHFVAPQAWRIAGLEVLEQEVFGPFLHIVTWQSGQLESLLEDINHLGYGLTLGLQSRIRSRWQQVAQLARVGNVYINRDMIGANVGIQPFGGQGLSGTGPKAGGPAYLQRFAVEQSISINTAAIGGNPSLLGGD